MRTKLCKCGCMGFACSGNMFINGHNKSTLDRHVPDDVRVKISNTLKASGIMSEVMKRNWQNSEYRKKAIESRRGVPLSDEHKLKMSIAKLGERHWNWKGGITNQQYCEVWSDKVFEEYILERDNYECKNPECLKRPYKRLTRHHINYDKKNCSPDNLIVLCNSCNVRANFNREYWNELFREIREGSLL